LRDIKEKKELNEDIATRLNNACADFIKQFAVEK